ncbi:hypothetical protein [Nonomuraea sp. NPDC049309]|uniref:hypothetical protein n=1 Tax=Nonomuraea sp. NPDC049309 TaxID=3364350 RepID=UPI00371A28C3
MFEHPVAHHEPLGPWAGTARTVQDIEGDGGSGCPIPAMCVPSTAVVSSGRTCRSGRVRSVSDSISSRWAAWGSAAEIV